MKAKRFTQRMKVCAYCESDEVLTREHIWPSSLIQKYEGRMKTYNQKLDDFVSSDPVIKDVCKECNNIKLSKLDAYISKLYDQYLSAPLMPGDGAEIEYDYNLLLRALLKISYNSCRASTNNKTIKTHSRHKKYILEGGYYSNIRLRLLIVTPAKIMVDGKLTGEHLPVTQLRCAEILYDGHLKNRFIVRLIAINSFWFYIILSHKPEPKNKWEDFIEGFKSWKMQTGIHIKPNSTKLVIPVNQTTYMHPSLLGTMGNAILGSRVTNNMGV